MKGYVCNIQSKNKLINVMVSVITDFTCDTINQDYSVKK